MVILGLFPGNIVLLGCTSAIIDFDILCIMWVFTVDVSLTETGLLICENTIRRVTF